MLSQNVLRYGREQRAPDKIALRAGPLSLIFTNGEIRHVALGDHEILRRIYVAVRVQHWVTIPARIATVFVDVKDDTFRLTFDAIHKEADAHFRWQGTITGDEHGTITFTMDGAARSTFLRNRIGICVLHPIDGCAGRPCIVEKVNGIKQNGSLPLMIAPHQPFVAIRGFSHEVMPDVQAELAYSGDTFEMEDQRNWTDASFKTYSTTLNLPLPVEVRNGTRISQSVTLSIKSKSPLPKQTASTVETPVLRLSVDQSPVGRLPRIGLGNAARDSSLTPTEIAKLKALHITHLRIELKLFQRDYEPSLNHAVCDSKELEIPLNLALFVSDKMEEELKTLANLLSQARPAVRLCHVFNMGGSPVTADCMKLTRKILSGFDKSIGVGTGSDNYFVDLNRNRPAEMPLDHLCYSMNPQVHNFDDDAIFENLEGQAWTVLTAKEFAGGRPIVVGPVTLRPRFVRGAPDAVQIGPDGLPRFVDPRQLSLLGAAWTLGSIKQLAEAGAASATYYETTGWCGVMQAESGVVYPVYHVLADVGEFADAEVLPVRSSNKLRVDGLALQTGDRRRILAANLTCDTRRVLVSASAPQAGVRHLDETNAVAAMGSPEDWRARRDEIVQSVNGEFVLDLLPYSIARLDCSR